ncbi:MAG TPA: hypothetical protein VLR10_01640 [Nitrososphaeraceae archaeon]|nr:hypothetical protein [Nitrososphaeraceae archaeon]
MIPIKDASDAIVYEFVATFVMCRVWFPDWLAFSFSDNVLIWPSTEVIYWNAVKLMASDRNRNNRFEVEFFIVI